MKERWRIVLGFILVLVSATVFAQVPGDGKELVKYVIGYLGLQDKATPVNINDLAGKWVSAQDPDTTKRKQAYRELFVAMNKIRGIEGTEQALNRAVDIAAGWTGRISSENPGLEPVSKAKELGPVTKMGTGNIDMILIPDLGYDSSVFASYMKRNEKNYRMFAITIPGFGKSLPPGRQTIRDFAKTAWWKNAEEGILALIQKERMNRPVILGHQAGAYLAARLALDHPDQVRAGIVLNGLIFAPMPSLEDPNKQATMQQKLKRVNESQPIDFFPRPTVEEYRSFLSGGSAWLCRNDQRQKELLNLLVQMDSHVWWMYFSELMTTDLSNDLKRLKTPLLVVPSIHDAQSPGAKGPNPAVDQWASFHAENPSVPLEIQAIKDSRVYAMDDQPEKLDETISMFLKKRGK